MTPPPRTMLPPSAGCEPDSLLELLASRRGRHPHIVSPFPPRLVLISIHIVKSSPKASSCFFHRHFFAFGSSVSQRCRPSCLPKNPRGGASVCHPPWTDLSPPICSSSGKSQPTREVSPAATQP